LPALPGASPFIFPFIFPCFPRLREISRPCAPPGKPTYVGLVFKGGPSRACPSGCVCFATSRASSQRLIDACVVRARGP
jgi:hypothetical protein